jgi:hypothetical protein
VRSAAPGRAAAGRRRGPAQPARFSAHLRGPREGRQDRRETRRRGARTHVSRPRPRCRRAFRRTAPASRHLASSGEPDRRGHRRAGIGVRRRLAGGAPVLGGHRLRPPRSRRNGGGSPSASGGQTRCELGGPCRPRAGSARAGPDGGGARRLAQGRRGRSGACCGLVQPRRGLSASRADTGVAGRFREFPRTRAWQCTRAARRRLRPPLRAWRRGLAACRDGARPDRGLSEIGASRDPLRGRQGARRHRRSRRSVCALRDRREIAERAVTVGRDGRPARSRSLARPAEPGAAPARAPGRLRVGQAGVRRRHAAFGNEPDRGHHRAS